MTRLALTARYVTQPTATMTLDEGGMTRVAQELNRCMADSWSARANYGLIYGQPWEPLPYLAPATSTTLGAGRMARAAAGTVR